MGKLDGKRIAVLAADGVEQIELTQPWEAVKDAGAEVELLSLESGQIQGFNHLDHGDKFDVDKKVADADVVAHAQDRPGERGSDLGRRAGSRGSRPDDLAQSG